MTSTFDLEDLVDNPAEQALPGSSARKRGRPRDPEADQRILTAAAELILRRGYDHMTVDAVASRAHVGKATVYRRWARKEDLAVAAMAVLYDTEMPMPDTGAIHTDLMVTFQQTLAFVNGEPGAAYLRMTVVESVRDPRIAELYHAAQQRAEDGALALFERAITRGEVRHDVNLRWAVQFLVSQLVFCAVSGQPMPTLDQLSELVAFVLRGAGTEKALDALESLELSDPGL